MGPLVNRAAVVGTVERAVPADHFAAGTRLEIDPDLVRVGGSLREYVTDVECAQHHFHQVGRAGRQRRQVGPELAEELAVNTVPFAQAKKIDAQLLVFAFRIGAAQKIGLELDGAAEAVGVGRAIRIER